ncbi:MAG: Lar family restriction alleviation protein [Pseudomonadota bacterium]
MEKKELEAEIGRLNAGWQDENARGLVLAAKLTELQALLASRVAAPSLEAMLDQYQAGERELPTYAELRALASAPVQAGLLPCPFCGSHSAKVYHDTSSDHRHDWNFCVSCDCGACGEDDKNSDEAIDAWNRRAAIEQHVSAAPVHQFRRWGCSDWYDGHPDHEDGGGPYEARTLFAARTPAAPVVDAEGLIALLESIRPNYGAVGSRDVDVTAQRSRIDAAIAMLRAPVVDLHAASDDGMHASIFVKVWGDAGGGDAGRIALAEYAFRLGAKSIAADREQRLRDVGKLMTMIDPFHDADADALPAGMCRSADGHDLFTDDQMRAHAARALARHAAAELVASKAPSVLEDVALEAKAFRAMVENDCYPELVNHGNSFMVTKAGKTLSWVMIPTHPDKTTACRLAIAEAMLAAAPTPTGADK